MNCIYMWSWLLSLIKHGFPISPYFWCLPDPLQQHLITWLGLHGAVIHYLCWASPAITFRLKILTETLCLSTEWFIYQAEAIKHKDMTTDQLSAEAAIGLKGKEETCIVMHVNTNPVIYPFVSDISRAVKKVRIMAMRPWDQSTVFLNMHYAHKMIVLWLQLWLPFWNLLHTPLKMSCKSRSLCDVSLWC